MSHKRKSGIPGRTIRNTKKGIPAGYLLGNTVASGNTSSGASLISFSALADQLTNTGKIVAVGGGVASINLEQLKDVDITSVTNGQALVWDSATSEWVNGTPATTDLEVTDGTHNEMNVTEIVFSGAVVSSGGAGIADVAITQPTGANPTATAGPAAVNGSASTFMRSDGAPAVQKASASQFGIVKVDGTTITATGGVITSGFTVPVPNGMLPLVTGDTPGPVLIADAEGQCIGVPL